MENKEVVIVQGKLRKVIHAEGEGELPQKGQEIFALYRGTLENGKQFDANQNRDSPFNFTLGQGAVIKGWDEGFATMRRGEKATLICGPDYAYGARGSPPSIPANATLNFEVELLDFKDKKKEKWEYSDEEKLAEATALKASGNDKLKSGDYKGATADYKEGIDFLENESSSLAKQLLNILRLNSAQAFLKLNRNSEVIDNCSKVLKEEGDCLKALYRRGLAYIKLQDFEKATGDFKELLKYDPANAEAVKELANVAVAVKQAKEKEKKFFGSIFSKGGLYDDVKTETKPPAAKENEEIDSPSDEQEAPTPVAQPVQPAEPEIPLPEATGDVEGDKIKQE